MYEFFRKYTFVNMVSVKMQISQIPLILSNERKTNGLLTFKLSFCYYTVKLIECMIGKLGSMQIWKICI